MEESKIALLERTVYVKVTALLNKRLYLAWN